MPASSDRPSDPLLNRSADAPGLPLSRGRERGAGGEGLPIVVTATLPAGVALHARPAADLVRAASRLQAQVTVSANGKRANARSILEVLALGATAGTELTITTSGPGAAQAASALAEVVASLGT
jgi:phosphocarrier protein HPr